MKCYLCKKEACSSYELDGASTLYFCKKHFEDFTQTDPLEESGYYDKEDDD